MAECYAVYSPSKNVVIDIVPIGLGAHDAAIRKYAPEYGNDLTVLPISEAAKRYDAGWKSPPKEIKEEDWMYALEVLPPCKWSHKGGGESFHVSELLAGNIANIYVRIGERYFQFSDDFRMSPEERVNKVKEVM